MRTLGTSGSILAVRPAAIKIRLQHEPDVLVCLAEAPIDRQRAIDVPRLFHVHSNRLAALARRFGDAGGVFERELRVDVEADVSEFECDVGVESFFGKRAQQPAVFCVTARVSPRSCTLSPRIVAATANPCAFAARATGKNCAAFSPATKRRAPKRMPYRVTARRTSALSAAARIPARNGRSKTLFASRGGYSSTDQEATATEGRAQREGPLGPRRCDSRLCDGVHRQYRRQCFTAGDSTRAPNEHRSNAVGHRRLRALPFGLDSLGRSARRPLRTALVFAAGIVLFAASSLACALAGNITGLIVARCVQGIGGALSTPGSLALISAAYDDERADAQSARGRVFRP